MKSIDLTPHQLVVRPGNPSLCGPVWGAQADVGGGSWASSSPEGGSLPSWESARAPAAYMAALFPEQATWGTLSANNTILAGVAGLTAPLQSGCAGKLHSASLLFPAEHPPHACPSVLV